MSEIVININKVPSFNTARTICRWIPDGLSTERLIKYYAKISVICTAHDRGRLPADYFRLGSAGTCIGRVPRDAYLIPNLKYLQKEYWKEIRKRGIQNIFTIFDMTTNQK